MKCYLVLVIFVCNWGWMYAQPPTHANWRLAWNDEFNGINADLDTGWNSSNGGYKSTSINCSRWRRNAVVKDGTLKMYYRKEKTSGGTGTSAWNYDWTAASLSTKRKFKFGYFECRYRIASAKGTNNSFWLISGKNADTAIKTFEIDINEGQFARNVTDTWHQIRTNVHNWSDTFRNNAGTVTHPTASFHTNPSPWYNTGYQYHIMGLEWNEKELIWYVDGKIIRRSPNVKAYRSAVNCFDDAPILLSGATIPWMSGIGGVIPDSVNGKYMEVDYVRVYEQVSTPAVKLACIGNEVNIVAHPGIPDATAYRWQVSLLMNGTYSNYTDLTNGIVVNNVLQGIGANYSGVQNNTLTIKNVPSSLQNARFRCMLTTNTFGTTATVPTGSVAYKAPYVRFSGTTTLTLHTSIVASAQLVDTVALFGASVRMRASATGGSGNNTTFTWSGPNGFTSNSQLAFVDTLTLATNGTYIVTIADQAGCKDSAKVHILATTSVTLPLQINTTIPIIISAYSNLILNASASGGSGNYTQFYWQGPNGFSSIEQNPVITAATVANAGKYTVFVTDHLGVTGSKTVTVSVEKRNQNIHFPAITNKSYTGTESPAYGLVATATSGLPINFKTSNSTLLSIIGKTFVANKKRPDYSIELAVPISTNKIRIFSTQTPHFHIRECRVYAPNANGYPQNVLDDNADNQVAGLINYANDKATTLQASGSFDPNNFSYQAANANDGLIATSWVSQTGASPKFIELIFPAAVSVGCIQMVNGYFSGGAWQGLIASFSIQYWDGSAWKDVSDCSVKLTALQIGDDNTLPATAEQLLCVNTLAKTINNTTSLPANIIDFSVKLKQSIAHIQWTVASQVNVAMYEVQKSLDGVLWYPIAQIPAHDTTLYSIADAQMHLLASKVYYRIKVVDKDGAFKYSETRNLSIHSVDINIKFFPNPVNDVLKFVLDNTIRLPFEVVIYDVFGIKILEKTFLTSSPILNTNSLRSGVYVLKIKINNQYQKYTLIKN